MSSSSLYSFLRTASAFSAIPKCLKILHILFNGALTPENPKFFSSAYRSHRTVLILFTFSFASIRFSKCRILAIIANVMFPLTVSLMASALDPPFFACACDCCAVGNAPSNTSIVNLAGSTNRSLTCADTGLFTTRGAIATCDICVCIFICDGPSSPLLLLLLSS